MRGDSGQAAAELVAVLPVIVVLLLVCGQITAAGWTLWSAATAARAGARAEAVGDDGEGAAEALLPSRLGDGAEIEAGAGGVVRVEVDVPRLLPGLPRLPVAVASRLEPEAPG